MNLSVIITTRDRSDLLAATLDSLTGLDTTGIDWELIVVDNGSRDTTPSVLERHARDLPLKVLQAPLPGKTRAQNIAVRKARGALLVFTDDDVVFDRDWLQEFATAAERWPDDGIFGGQIDIALPAELPAWLQGPSMRGVLERHFAHYAPREAEGPTEAAPLGPSMAIRARLLAQAQFDENVGPDGSSDYIKGGDTDLCHDLASRGERFIFVPAAKITHHVRPRQLQLDSILGGVFRRGRKNAYLYPKESTKRIAGAPPSLWFKFWRQRIRYFLAWPFGSDQRYRAGIKYHYRRGYLYQCRLQNRSDTIRVGKTGSDSN